ncbi:MAG: hypothetical protein ACUVQ3_09875 [bacterium]
MALICRCDQCEEIILRRNLQYVCDECGARFCSLACQKKHQCSGLPYLHAPWEEDIEFEPNEFDIVEILKMLLEYHRSNHTKNLKTKKVGRKAKCAYCQENKMIIWDDVDLGSLCADCLNDIRTNILKDICSQTNDTGIEIDQFRIIHVPDEPKTRPTHLLALCLAKMDIEQRFYRDITLEIGNELKKEKFVLYDFRIWIVDEITIMHVDDKILEFTPGTYLIICVE